MCKGQVKEIHTIKDGGQDKYGTFNPKEPLRAKGGGDKRYVYDEP
jgi:hypothetical protein